MLRGPVLILGLVVVAVATATAEDGEAAPTAHPAQSLIRTLDDWREFRAAAPVQLDPRQRDPALAAIDAKAFEAFAAFDPLMQRIADVGTAEPVDVEALAELSRELEEKHQAIVTVQAELATIETAHMERVFADRPLPEDSDPAIGAVAWLTNDPTTWPAWRTLDALARGGAEERERAEALAQRLEEARRARVTVVHITRGEALARRREEVRAEYDAALAAILAAKPRQSDEAEAEATTAAPTPSPTPFVDTSAFRGWVHHGRLAVEKVRRELHVRLPAD